MNVRINLHGLITLIFIVLGIVIGLLQQGKAPIWYLALGIILYGGTVFLISNRREAQEADKRFIISPQLRLLYMRILVGAHLAFVFLIVGEFLFVQWDLLLQAAYFVVAIIFALVIPFVVLTSSSASTKP